MARKHPLDDPPAVSSSDEEEEEDIGEEGEEDVEETEEEADEPNPRNQQDSVESDDDEEELKGKEEKGEEEEDDEEEEEEEEEPQLKKGKNQSQIVRRPTSKNPNRQRPTKPNAKEDSDVSETESDSSSIPHCPSVSDFAIKPHVVTKPSGASPKPNKPATIAAEKIPAKRSAESISDRDGKDSSSKAKKVKASNSNNENVGGEEGTVASEKKGMINRLWSDEDEIAILKGMIEFQSKKGTDPNSDYTAFHEFMKNYLSVDVSRNQLMDKVRRLKKKYRNNVGKGDNGEDPILSKPHDCKCFQLSKKIWGGMVAANVGKRKHKGSVQDSVHKSNVERNKKSSKPDGDSVHLMTLPKEEVSAKKQEEQQAKGEEAEFSELYPFLSDALKLSSQSSGSLFTDGVKIFEQNATYVGKLKLNELEEKCRKQKLSETEVFIGRAELTRELAEIMVEVIKSQKC